VGFGPTKTLAKLANQTAKTADRKPGAYPGFAPSRIEQVCDFGAMSQAELEQVYRQELREGRNLALPRDPA